MNIILGFSINYLDYGMYSDLNIIVNLENYLN